MEPDMQSFLTRGYTLMPIHPRIRVLIETAMPLFLRLVDDLSRHPENIALWQCDHGAINDPDTGMVFKESAQIGPDGTRYDTKAYFHYRHYLWNVLQVRNVKLKAYQEEFLVALGELWDVCQEHALQFAQLVDEALPGYHIRRGLSCSHDSVVRFLCYLRERPDADGVIAQPHVDRNAITFALYENKPGFQIARIPGTLGDWIDISSQTNRALVFPSSRLDVLTQGVIKPSWHRVIGANEKNGDAIRTSVIFFANNYGVPWKRTHQAPLPFPAPK